MKKLTAELAGLALFSSELKRAPDFFHQLVDFWFGLFEFAADEGVEVVRTKVGFGHFGEKFFLICEPVMFSHGAAVGEGGLILATSAELFPSLHDPLVLKAKHLVVIRVSQFVENDEWHATIGRTGKKSLDVRDVDTSLELFAIAVFFEPFGTRVVLHSAHFAVVEIDLDGDFL